MKSIRKLIYISILLFITNTYSQCFTSVSCGENNVTARRPNGSIWVWGRGENGELGNGSGQDEFTPLQIGTASNWLGINSGYFDITFAIQQNGSLWGTGNNLYGGLGVGTTTILYSNLTQIGTATNGKQVASDGSFTIAVKTDNSLWAWGQNDGYQMGNGSCCANRLAPAQIGTATDWRMAAVSKVSSAFAIKNNGTLWCWGANIAGLLGDNLVTGRALPTQHNSDTDWQSITVGVAHILALKTNGTLWAWGSDGQGQTANDGTVAYYTPHQIGTSTWKAVAGGLNTSYGIKTDGTLWAWGQNDLGQLGLGNTNNQHFPVQIGTDSDWDKVSAGGRFAIAVKNNGALWAWGDNTFGQFGNGTTTSSATPVDIPISGCTLANEEFVLEDSVLVLSPNPSKSNVTVTYDSRSEAPVLELYSILGKKITEFKAISSSGNWELTTSALPSGVYVVVMKENNLVLTQQKLIVE